MKKLLLAFLVLPALLLSGCSDYPSEGTVDTRVVREQADIQEITGSVYGIKPGAKDALIAIEADRKSIRSFDNDVWEAVKAQKPDAEMPALALQYDAVDSSRMLSVQDAVIKAAKAQYERQMSEYNSEIEALEADLAKYQETMNGLEQSEKDHSSYIAEFEKAYEEAGAKLESAKKAYNDVFQTAIQEVSAAAEKEGVQGSYSDSLIGRYRSIDFSKQSSNPATCPAQRGYFSVDVRDINKLCAYLRVPRNVQGTTAEAPVKKIMSEKFREFVIASNELGQKGSWGRNGTGMYAKVAVAKKALNDAENEADQKFGNAREREYKIRNAERYVARINEKLEQMKTDDYIQSYALTSYMSDTPEAFNDAREAYGKAVGEHFTSNYVAKITDITMADVDGITVGVFEEVESGYEYLISLTDVLASSSGRKEVVRSIDILDTSSPEVKEADALTFAITRDNIEMRGRDTSEEKKVVQAISALKDKLDV